MIDALPVPRPAHADPAHPGLLDRLAELDAVVQQIDTRAANTRRSYDGDWRTWQDYTADAGIPTLAATPGALAGYIAWLTQQGYAPSTVSRRLYGAVVGLRRQGVTVPEDATTRARELLDALRRELNVRGEQRGRGKADPITVPMLRRMSAALPDTLAGVRDRAILLIGFGAAARRSETAALLARDVEVQDQGLIVHVRYSKTKPRHPALLPGAHPLTCPVQAWQAWADAVDLDQDGPAFRRIDRHGRVLGGISPQSIGSVVASAAERAGIPGITGHSLRAGLATEARRAGHDAKTIAEQGGWSPNSRVLYEYMRVVDQWADNATAGLGL